MLHILSIAIIFSVYYNFGILSKSEVSFMRMRDRLIRFMAGRNGADQLARFVSIVSCVLLLVSMFIRSGIGTALWVIAFALLIYSYFRMFSKNTAKRYAENAKFLTLKYKVTNWFSRKKDRVKQMKTHRFYPCPQCGITTRIPKGKGKIKITCPKCGNQFIRKS